MSTRLSKNQIMPEGYFKVRGKMIKHTPQEKKVQKKFQVDIHASERANIEREMLRLKKVLDNPYEENKWVEEDALKVCEQRLRELDK